MIIKKTPNEYESYNISLIDEGKVLSLMQTGDDHTFVARLDDYSHITNLDFVIPESEEIYALFNRLYERIITGNVMDWDMSTPEEMEKAEMERSTSWYKQVVQDSDIKIMCDAYPIKCPNTLTISKVEGAIVLRFEKVENPRLEYKSKFSISINIRQSGSRIYDLAFPFKLLFRELQLVKDSEVKQKKLDAND